MGSDLPPPATTTRKRVREQLTVAAARQLGNDLVWRVAGKDVPVAPPPWSVADASANSGLCAHISAHNSYVAAAAAREAVEAIAAAVEGTDAPPTERQRKSSATASARRPTTSRRSNADGISTTPKRKDVSTADVGEADGARSGEEEQARAADAPADAVVNVAGPAAAPKDDYVVPTAWHKTLPRVSKNKTPAGERRPSIQALRSCLTKKTHRELLAPSTNDAVYLPRSSHLSFFREVVMSAAKVNAEEADNLLKSTFEVPAASRNDKPSTKELKPWLGKALNNVHFNLRKSIIKAWSAAVDYNGTKEQALSYLKGRGYLKGPVGRRGFVAAFMAAVAQCSGDPDEHTFPDGPDNVLLNAVLVTLAFVLSKVSRWEAVLYWVSV
ncbi:hypothetical protein I4F81_000511 [Pyropia yezoensis]|uniref:Uncharacterized protein n=1 Tax=Pyropia yezoensis TaxID=2788 RepID=A0ACC3BJ16_PYRYE|nr:hypothetical protein I4F81_000511 [Neopyropia yezoensis]